MLEVNGDEVSMVKYTIYAYEISIILTKKSHCFIPKESTYHFISITNTEDILPSSLGPKRK